MGLEGKVALVTGGSRGIGRAVVLELARAGADVAINYVENEMAARQVAEEIAGMGRESLVIRTNVGDSAAVEGMVKEVISTFGQVDILVNNAGIIRDSLVIGMKDEEWDEVINVNLKGVYNCIKAIAFYMIKQRAGRIINISSVVGRLGSPGQANYVAAKSGVIGLTKTVAKELADRGIKVNAVAPGFIKTEMTDSLDDDVLKSLQTQIPLGYLGTPEDIARVVRFLASDDAAYMTGQILSVDGGMYMG